MKLFPQEMRKDGAAAFSLVEVVLALGVAVFALIGIIGLLPLGIKSTGESVDESRAVDILTSMIADRQATPYAATSKIYGLPALTGSSGAVTGTNVFGITGQDSSSGSDLTKARYQISYVITSPASGRPDPYLIWFRVTWPALNSSESASVLETVAAFPQQ